MRARSEGRILALQLLYRMSLYPDGAQSDDIASLIPRMEEDGRPPLKSAGIQFALLLAQGVTEHIESLDAIISTQAEYWKIDRLRVIDKLILRLSLYAIIHLPDIPVAVTINEAIELAKMYSDHHSTQFIHGVLDGFVKSRA